VSRRRIAYQGCINTCLDDSIEALQIAYSAWDETRCGESQSESATDFFQGNIVTWFGAGQVQLGCRLGIHDFLFTKLS
jgi:hypothetical protein